MYDILLTHILGSLGHLSEDTSVLLGDDSLDDQQDSDHQDDTDSQADDPVLDQAGQDEHHEGHSNHSQSIGDLSEHVVQVVAVCTS